jgi:hypothetical protein
MSVYITISDKLVNDLDRLIEERKYRISPRWSFQDRLARFVQMHFEQRENCMDLDDARCVCDMILLKHNGSSSVSIASILSELQNSTKRHVYVGRNGKMNITVRYGTHPMVTRSQSISHQ